MERNYHQLSRDLTRAEKSLLFMQKEHQSTLSGLHQEIAHLTQKCSDMQFMLAMQTETSNLAEQQKETIKRLQSDCDSLQSSNNSLETQLSDSKLKETELESQISWEKLQHDNLVNSLRRQLEEKDAKLVKLKKEFNTNSEVASLQAHVKQIYLDNSSYVQSTIQDVSKRARSPVGIRIRRRSRPRTRGEAGSEMSDESLESYSSLYSSLAEEKDNNGNSSVPQPAQYVSPGTVEERQERRAAVFRHHTRLQQDDQTGYYSYSAPPLSLAARTVRRTNTLPIDYKAPVATLPYLARDTEEVATLPYLARDTEEVGPASLTFINNNLGESSL